MTSLCNPDIHQADERLGADNKLRIDGSPIVHIQLLAMEG